MGVGNERGLDRLVTVNLYRIRSLIVVLHQFYIHDICRVIQPPKPSCFFCVQY